MKKLLSIITILLIGCTMAVSAQNTVSRQTPKQSTTQTKKKTQTGNTTSGKKVEGVNNATEGNSKPEESKKEYIYIFCEPDGVINGHDYVDLGLPSGLKWATCNVGAKTPNEIGYYFDWGSITPAVGGVDGHLNKDMDISGNPQYDAAAYFWKASWKMPSKENWRELLAFCTHKEVNIDGKKFAEFTGPSGKAIIIPLAGYRFYQYSYSEHDNEYGEYWTSEGKSNSDYVHMSKNSSSLITQKRMYALPIRPVTE